MAILGYEALAIAAYGTVYAYTGPEIPKVSAALIVSSCLVGAVSGLLGLRLGTFVEQARRCPALGRLRFKQKAHHEKKHRTPIRGQHFVSGRLLHHAQRHQVGV